MSDMKIKTIFTTLNNSPKPKIEEKGIIIEKKNMSFSNVNYLVRSMNEFELDMFEERTSIMAVENNWEEEQAEIEAAKDIISLRDSPGLTSAIVNILGGLELRNEKINIHTGVKRK